MSKKTSARRYELDWLRVYAIFLLLSIHAAAIFDPFPVTAVKGQESLVMKLFAMFVHQWRLAILFLISGAGAYFALGSLQGRQFITMRFRRIVIPLIFGTLVVVPVHLYYWVSGKYPGRYASYLDFYTTMLKDAFLHGRIWNKPEYLHWAHLWFLAYLFLISLVTCPALVFLRKESNRTLTAKLATLFEGNAALLIIPALPLVITEVILRPFWDGEGGPNLVNDWANFTMYLIYYVYGFLIYSDNRLRASVARVSPAALSLAIVMTTIFFLTSFTGESIRFGWILFRAYRTFESWFWILAILGFGIKYLNYSNRFLPDLNEAAYPIYIIHLPILSIIAYHVVKWSAPVGVQFIVIVVGTLAGSLAIYFLLIRQTVVTRYLFGLKPEPPARR